MLQSIASDGHVYSLGFNQEPPPAGRSISARRVGINKASVFKGFCEKHDNELFRPLDEGPLVPTPEQTFLLAYRALCMEVYLKQALLNTIPVYREADRGRNAPEQLAVQAFVSGIKKATEVGLRDLSEHRRVFDDDYRAADYSCVRGLAIRLDATPGIACSTTASPECDAQGRPLQNLLDLKTRLDLLTFCLLPNDEGGLALFAWRVGNPKAEAFVESFLKIPEPQMPQALLQFSLETSENVYLSIPWWDGLSSVDESALIKMAEVGLPVGDALRACGLGSKPMPDLLWTVQEVRTVGWNDRG